MEFNDEERDYLSWKRMLSTDDTGEEIYVGLSKEESIEYHTLTRRTYRSSGKGDDFDRYLALHQKVEKARVEVLSAEFASKKDDSNVQTNILPSSNIN